VNESARRIAIHNATFEPDEVPIKLYRSIPSAVNAAFKPRAKSSMETERRFFRLLESDDAKALRQNLVSR
jgi:hypothetical protein